MKMPGISRTTNNIPLIPPNRSTHLSAIQSSSSWVSCRATNPISYAVFCLKKKNFPSDTRRDNLRPSQSVTMYQKLSFFIRQEGGGGHEDFFSRQLLVNRSVDKKVNLSIP